MAKVSGQCDATVLRHVNYGEADIILTMFTADFGLQQGFAKSARKSRKRFGAVLESFTQATFYWQCGRGSMWLLQDADLLSQRIGLRRSLAHLALASYGVELVELLLENGQPHVRIYELLGSYLDYLDAGGDIKTARLLFELRLIYLLGYMPHLLHCSECLKIFSNEKISFDANRGGCLCALCAGRSGFEVEQGSVGTLARSLKVSHRQFAGFNFGQQTLFDANLIFQQVLELNLPRQPKSLKFLS